MGFFRNVASAALLDRLLRGQHGPQHRRRGYAHGGYPPAYGARRPRPRSGVRMAGPFPTYSRTTRRGNRVSVGGCCLPIPLTVLASAAGALAVRRSIHRQGAQR